MTQDIPLPEPAPRPFGKRLGFAILIMICIGLGWLLVAQPQHPKILPTIDCEEVFASGKPERTYISYTTNSGTIPARRSIEYKSYGELAVVEGDIVLGTVSKMKEARFAVENNRNDELGIYGIVISGIRFRWPGGKIYYTVDEDIPRKERVLQAISDWTNNTSIRFVPRTNESNYVTFRKRDGCGAEVGMCGGQQFIWVSDECSKGNVMHEIGHTVGLWHEQSRLDRDNYVDIQWDNIADDKRSEFKQHIYDGLDVRAYDFDSIMHYPGDAFSRHPPSPTILTKPKNQPIGQRLYLSAGDKAAVMRMYPTQ